MVGEQIAETQLPLPHIIERPRLMQLLSNADARAVLVIAPAGYGKTTLAEQWLRDKPHVLFRASPAASDVAVLTSRLADCAATITGQDPARLKQRVALSPDPELELTHLTRLLVELFDGWPDDAWLAIDDYHHLIESASCEAVVEGVWAETNVHVLIASRRRPDWASARRLLYGEVFEIGRHSMTMDIAEANAVLGRSRSASGLVALAEGWPAVIGLAAMAKEHTSVDRLFEGDLYDYFADELFIAAAADRRADLCALAVPPRITDELAVMLFGAEAADGVLADATRLGFTTRGPSGEWRLHPLLRGFLLDKFHERAPGDKDSTVERVFTFLHSASAWDDAFSVAELFRRQDLVEPLVCAALPEMLSTGRLATLRRWQDFGTAANPASTVIDAEIAFRQGSHAEAEAIAKEALAVLPQDHSLRPNVLFRAGQAAYFLGHEAAALEYLDEAKHVAQDPALEKEARWAAFITALDLDPSRATQYLREFEEARDPSIDDSIRLGNAQLLTAIRCGGISDALAAVETTAKVIGRARDPMIKTAFLNVYGCALAHNGQYSAAIKAANEEREEAKLAGLSFVDPHADLLEALARVGLRDVKRADLLVRTVAQTAREMEDGFLSLSAKLVRARLMILTRRPLPAPKNLVDEPVTSCRLTYGELLGIHAIATAATGDRASTGELIRRIAEVTNHAEARALTALAAGVVKVATGEDAISATGDAIELAEQLGHLDSVVTAYRAFPPLIEVADRAGFRRLMESLLRSANDVRLAGVYGLPTKRDDGTTASVLSNRERQVLDLVAQGKTNDEIANALFISSVTVKAHLRHIYEKLGVRNRVEAAAALAVTERPPLVA